jgi:hypothetical protein
MNFQPCSFKAVVLQTCKCMNREVLLHAFYQSLKAPLKSTSCPFTCLCRCRGGSTVCGHQIQITIRASCRRGCLCLRALHRSGVV